MPTFRLLNQAPQYLLADGTVNAGGSLSFFDTDLTTPRNTWSDPDKTTLNPNPVVLDAAGRAATDIWLDGAYGVVLKDADGVVIWTRNNVELPGGTSTGLPAPVADQFVYSPDGVAFVMASILQVPDPTGLSTYILTSDGTGTPVWQQPATVTIPAPDIVVGDDSFQAGVSDDTQKFLLQKGSGSASAGGTKTATATITFGTAFAATPVVHVTPTTASACATANIIPSWAVASKSTSGFTVTFSTLTGGTSADNYSASNIVNAVAFDWTAIGTRTVSP